ncbi:hypothetical protein CLF_109023 [Clonorchis sinensis]|uniref:Uncharacterized protein n=1 Tax=Clonorchis sinensis TaxID=79923 RepID=G7YS70_CLOSI|nr:hypothetical protein CLF_109023 [Clonorchis sinensis]
MKTHHEAPTASTIGYRYTDLVLYFSKVKVTFIYDLFTIAVRLAWILIDVRSKQAEDDVDKVLTAERQSLKRLKHTLEKYLARVQSSSQDLITVKTMLQGLLDEYAERLRKLSRCKRQSALATTNIRYASSSEGFSADSMNPRKLLTLVESFFQQALGLRKELDSLFARVPPFVRSTQNSVHQALLNNSAQLITRERDLVLLEMQQNQTRNRCLRMTHALVNQSGQNSTKTGFSYTGNCIDFPGVQFLAKNQIGIIPEIIRKRVCPDSPSGSGKFTLSITVSRSDVKQLAADKVGIGPFTEIDNRLANVSTPRETTSPPACKALKPVDKELVRLDEAKGQLDKEMHTIRRSIDADLHIARTRRKAETHRLCSRFAL